MAKKKAKKAVKKTVKKAVKKAVKKTAKKAVKKVVAKKTVAKKVAAKVVEKEIGTITHWYDNISVAVLDLKGTIRIGDRIKVKKGDGEFEDIIHSMQIDHVAVSSAGKGDGVAVKLDKEAKEGAKIYKIG